MTTTQRRTPADWDAQTVAEIAIATVDAAVESVIRERVLAALRARADECSTVGEVLALIEEVGP